MRRLLARAACEDTSALGRSFQRQRGTHSLVGWAVLWNTTPTRRRRSCSQRDTLAVPKQANRADNCRMARRSSPLSSIVIGGEVVVGCGEQCPRAFAGLAVLQIVVHTDAPGRSGLQSAPTNLASYQFLTHEPRLSCSDGALQSSWLHLGLGEGVMLPPNSECV
jgi:hypothetical protein